MSLVALVMLPVGAAWGQGATVDSAPRFLLVGVVLGRPDGPMAVLKDRRTGRDALYRVGDRIQDATLLAVATDRAILRAGGRDTELRLAASRRGGDVPIAVTPPPRGPIRGRIVPGPGPTRLRLNR